MVRVVYGCDQGSQSGSLGGLMGNGLGGLTP